MKILDLKISDETAPIVMVDDDFLVVESAQRYLKRSKLMNPLLAFSGGEGLLEYLGKVVEGEQKMPAIVLLDINMPRMNGFEVLEAVRSDDRFVDVPIIAMLTSSSDQHDIDMATRKGANEFLVKPFKPQEYQDFFDAMAA